METFHVTISRNLQFSFCFVFSFFTSYIKRKYNRNSLCFSVQEQIRWRTWWSCMDNTWSLPSNAHLFREFYSWQRDSWFLFYKCSINKANTAKISLIRYTGVTGMFSVSSWTQISMRIYIVHGVFANIDLFMIQSKILSLNTSYILLL